MFCSAGGKVLKLDGSGLYMLDGSGLYMSNRRMGLIRHLGYEPQGAADSVSREFLSAGCPTAAYRASETREI